MTKIYLQKEKNRLMTADEAADQILLRISIKNYEGATQMKLHKLLYYAQGFSLVLLNKPLFKNSNETELMGIRHFKYGPVVRDVYDDFSIYGESKILFEPINNIKLIQNIILDSLVEAFHSVDAIDMANITHEEAPWKETKRDEFISNEIILEYFSRVTRDEIQDDNMNELYDRFFEKFQEQCISLSDLDDNAKIIEFETKVA